MITRFKARMFIASLLLVCFAPLAALAQDVSVDINTTKSPAIAGKAAPDNILQFDVLVTATGGDNGNVVVSLGALPNGVAYDSQVAGIDSVYDPDTNRVVISTIADTVTDGVLINFSADNSTAAGSYSLTATITAADSNTDTTNDTDSDSYAITRESDLAVSIANNGTATPVAGQDNLNFTYSVTNNGPSNASNVTAAISGVNTGIILVADGCQYTPSQGTFTWPVWAVGTVADGATATLQEVCGILSSDSDHGATSDVTFGITGADEPDPDGTNNSATETITVAREYDLALTVADAPDPVLAGSGIGNLTHTFTLSRSGPSDADGVTVEIAPIVTPAGVSIDGVVASAGSFAGTTWTLPDPWVISWNGVNETLTITLTVDYTVGSCTDCISATGTVSATDGGTDTNSENDIAVDPTSVTAPSDTVTTFATSIDFLDGNSATVTATLTCNAGLPLSQSFDISDGSPVNFTMTELPFTTPGTMCEITVAGLDSAYSLAPASCLFETDTGTFALDGNNVCAFVASGNPATYTVSKVWNVSDGVTEEVVYDVDVTISCDSEILTVGGAPHDGSDTAMVTLGDGDSVVVTVDASAGAQCSATEDLQQSFVEPEASEDCTDADLTAGGSASCTFTNTAFYEGIPTLSQYGLAALILLMLGVGFAGIRRYV